MPKAWLALRRLRPDINLLMVVAIVGAIAIDEWFEAATVAFLFALSLALEAWSVGRARRAVAALMDLTPTMVRVLRDGREVEFPPQDVTVGTRFVVRPGGRIPLDGRVVRGSSDVNQAPITGESVPLSKGVDDTVYAGTINGDGLLEIESEKAAQDTTLARIIRLVGEAQSKRSPSEQWVEKFARIYTPLVGPASKLRTKSEQCKIVEERPRQSRFRNRVDQIRSRAIEASAKFVESGIARSRNDALVLHESERPNSGCALVKGVRHFGMRKVR